MTRFFAITIWLSLVSGCGETAVPRAIPTKATPPSAEPEDSEVASLNARIAQLQSELAEASSDQDDNDAVRQNLRRYVGAISESTDPILGEPNANPALRRRAAEAKFSAVVRQIPLDAAVLGPFLRSLDRIDAKARDDSLADVTAYYRVLALCEDISPEALGELDSVDFEAFVAAVVKMSKVKKTYADGPAMILQTAREADLRELDSVALELYERYAEKFPNESAAPFAAGSAERLRLVGQVVAVVEGAGLDGKNIALESYRGKVVVLDFWSTWSSSWAADLPTLKKYRTELGPKGFEIIGVGLDTDRVKMTEMLKSENVDWPQIAPALGLQDPWMTPLGLRFGVSELPYRLIFDREGRLIAFGSNLVELDPAIREALNPPIIPEP